MAIRKRQGLVKARIRIKELEQIIRQLEVDKDHFREGEAAALNAYTELSARLDRLNNLLELLSNMYLQVIRGEK